MSAVAKEDDEIVEISIACVQMRSLLGEREKNLAAMCRRARAAKAENPALALIVFPECATGGYECPEMYPALAETYPGGESAVILMALAKELSVHIVYGFVEKAEQGGRIVYYNSAALIDDRGTEVGRYRKAHLVEGMETAAFEKGDAFPVFDTAIGRIGIMICWDSMFPEVARMLALGGAELIIVPEAVETGIEREWGLALAARALDNVAYVISCNHAGTDRALSYFGRSAVYGPLGELLALAGEEDETLTATIDYQRVAKSREYFYMLRQRRPEVYSTLVTQDGP